MYILVLSAKKQHVARWRASRMPLIDQPHSEKENPTSFFSLTQQYGKNSCDAAFVHWRFLFIFA